MLREAVGGDLLVPKVGGRGEGQVVCNRGGGRIGFGGEEGEWKSCLPASLAGGSFPCLFLLA